MVVRYSWSMVACVCLVGALGCGGKKAASATSAPVITSFSPKSGPTQTVVTLIGSGFNGTYSVSVGGAASTFTIKSDNELQVTVPDTATTGIIGVSNSLGSGGTAGLGTTAADNAFSVTPVITAITPTSGSPGTVVTFTGTGLSGTQKVVFGSGPSANFFVNSANQLQATVPIGSSTGPAVVTASSGATASSPSFSYSGGGVTAPVIASFSPAQAATGSNVTLTGTGFLSVSGVKIGGVSAYFSSASDTQLVIQVPQAAASGLIEADGPLGNASTATAFLVVPTLDSFTPAKGAAGTLITVKGTGFFGATSVAFGAAGLANFIVIDANTILANVPGGAVTGPITVTTNGLTCQGSGSFILQATSTALPTITAVSASQAPVGQTVTLTGTGFTGATSVTVGGAAAIFTTASDTSLTLTVPALATSGFITVTNTLGVANSPGSFKVTPVITSITPLQGKVGTMVTLVGSGFVGTTSVSFGGGPAANFAVLGPNTVSAVVPAGSKSGAVSLVSSSLTCSSDANNTFTVNP